MAYFVAADCLDVLDRSCIDECPVDCIYEGGRKMYINPTECIDCGACEPVCPVTAISSDLRIAADLVPWRDDNAAFFDLPLPAGTGRSALRGVPASSGNSTRTGRWPR